MSSRQNKLGSFAILSALAAALSVSASAQAAFTLSYQLGPNGNRVTVADKDTISFTSTPVNSTNSATIFIQNTGTASGQLSGVSCVFCTPFDVAGLPLLPALVNPGGIVSFTLNFSPKSRGLATASLKLDFDSNSVSLGLSGLGTGPALIVQDITTSTTVSIPTDGTGTLAFAATNLNDTKTATLRVQNSGESAVTINSLTAVSNLSGEADFTLANVAPTPPTTLQPGGAIIFSVVFSPTKTVGTLLGRLLIDSPTNPVTVNLTGTASGPSLTFSFTVGGQTTQIPSNGSQALLFPNTPAGAKVTGTLTVTNAGNTAGSITSVSVTSPGYTVTTNGLPVSIQPGNSTTFTLVFAPVSASTINGTLTIDNFTFTVRGVGVTPQAIPSYSFTGVGDTSAALQQPSIGVTLASAYPFDLSGSLTLKFSSISFGDDSSIQFATGGRVVSFTIPAGQTAAVFGQSATAVQFQTGSVAGTITITPSFSIGSVDLTPAQPPAKTVVLAATAPQIQKVSVGTRSASSFELLITGYSTPRALSSITLSFTQSAGKALQTGTLTLDAGSAFNSWYQSAAAAATGSQFTASVTINVSGDATAVQSVAVTATNTAGVSTPVSASLQ
jgi:hypothetical protein